MTRKDNVFRILRDGSGGNDNPAVHGVEIHFHAPVTIHIGPEKKARRPYARISPAPVVPPHRLSPGGQALASPARNRAILEDLPPFEPPPRRSDE